MMSNLTCQRKENETTHTFDDIAPYCKFCAVSVVAKKYGQNQ